MGRSPGVFVSADDDLSQRSWRRRAISSKENSECPTVGRVANEGKRELRCKYCSRDISGKIHIKCAQCPKFDLCVECFSVGAEVSPHKSDHPYRVMDTFSLTLLSPNWNADEEILLLEGVEMYGLENRLDLAKHVGTKSFVQCLDHYITAYVDSPNFPLPEMSRVAGKNRKELFFMAKGPNEGERDLGTSYGSTLTTATGADKKASGLAQIDYPNSIEMEDSHSQHIESKEETSGDDGSSLIEMSGYNLKRQEFRPEYDNDAEQLLADIKFKETDTKADRGLKLRMLHIYNQRLDERERRKKLILERDLLYSDPLLKGFTLEEKQIYQRYNVFMRFHSKVEHEEMIKTIIEEHRIQKRIHELEDARRAGCRTSSEADLYLQQKRRKEANESACKMKEKTQIVSSRETASGQAYASTMEDWDITGTPGSDLLSENEKLLCCETRMLPSQYLRMQEIMSMQIFSGNISKKSDAYRFFRTSQNIVDMVYDMLVKKGIRHTLDD